MSTRPKAPEEKPHPMALLRQVQGQLSPELYTFLQRLCEQIEEQETALTYLKETLEDCGIAP